MKNHTTGRMLKQYENNASLMILETVENDIKNRIQGKQTKIIRHQIWI